MVAPVEEFFSSIKEPKIMGKIDYPLLENSLFKSGFKNGGFTTTY